MQPTARDKKIRTGAGLAIMALAALSVFMIFASGHVRWSEIPLIFLYGLQALFTLGVGVYLASGRGKAKTMAMIPGRWRRIGLVAIAFIGAGAVAFGFAAAPEALVTSALWPNMIGLWILLQFRSMSQRFRHKEEWTTGLSLEVALPSLATAFSQPELSATTVGQDVRVEIGREWMGGEWRHKDAARYMKAPTGIYFRVDEIDAGTRVTAHSGDRAVEGMYDVLKLSDEMSATAVELARQATTQHLEDRQS